jgi:hypothetical protein
MFQHSPAYWLPLQMKYQIQLLCKALTPKTTSQINYFHNKIENQRRKKKSDSDIMNIKKSNIYLSSEQCRV